LKTQLIGFHQKIKNILEDTMGKIIPRWEWRTFGKEFGEGEARIKAHELATFKKSSEKYILSKNSNENCKIRDDLMDITNDKAVPLTKQLMNDYEETHASTIAVMKVPHDDVSSYGVIDPQGEGVNGLYSVETFVEKPKPEDAPSDLAIIGRYLLTPEIFSILETQAPGAGNEIQLTDAIDTLNKTQRVFAREFTGDRYDVGDKFGFMKTSIDYALKHPQVKDDMKQYIIDLGKKLDKKKN